MGMSETWFNLRDQFQIIVVLSDNLLSDKQQEFKTEFCHCVQSSLLPLETVVNKFVLRQKKLSYFSFYCSFFWGDQFKKHFSRSVISIHRTWAEAQFTRKTFLALGPAKSQRLLESNFFFIDVSPNQEMNIFEACPQFIGEHHQKQFLSKSKCDQEEA